MRQPIQVILPPRRLHQVIFRRRPDGANWCAYVDARDRSEAIAEARLVLAHDRYREREHMDAAGRQTSDRDWLVVEVNLLEVRP